MDVKVRFAPSPTGPLHIGGARSALFNFLFAQNQEGILLLRIEDTDLERSKPEYENEIVESLSWLGINWSEGFGVGGPNGPYRQTERLDIYHRYVERLLREDLAYHCFCTEEELEEQRNDLMAKGEMIRYTGKCRHLDAREKEDRLRQGIVPTVRFKVPPERTWLVNDLVRGQVAFSSDNIGDFIIVKSDGIPTYNFAVVVDDHEMEVTHVIRAEEHLSNTPRQLMIYEALGFKFPEFAHASLILGSDRQKMSKRHGATSVMQYREKGYLPEAIFNFLALLGWSPDGEQEILDQEEITRQFSLDRVAKNPAVFDLDKLNWINVQHLKRKKPDELGRLLQPFLEKSPFKEKVNRLDQPTFITLVEAIRERLVCLVDVLDEIKPFFSEPYYDEDAQRVLQQSETKKILNQVLEMLPERIDLDTSQSLIKGLPRALGLSAKKVYMPLRIALTGLTRGPELPYLLMVMGPAEVRRRINAVYNL